MFLADEKRKDAEMNGSKRYLNLICSYSPRETHFDSLLSFLNI
jgi:hypothetical protein